MNSGSVDEKLLTILIPTRNRQSYCISTIEAVLKITGNNYEVIVQDNSDTNELEGLILSKFNDKRLIYRYTSKGFSPVDNFNAAASLAVGKYLCFIGDDDSVNPELIYAADWADRNGVDALSWNIKASYLWPGSIMKSTTFTNVKGARLSVYPFSGKAIKTRPLEEIARFLKSGGIDYQLFKLPKAYHGLVSRSLLERIREITGDYFGGLSLDCYSSLALATVAENAWFIDYPLSVAGSSPVSELTHNTEKAFLKPLKDAPHFRYRGPYEWIEIVPPVYTGETMQLESGLQGLASMNKPEILAELNYPKLAAHLRMTYPLLKTRLNDSIRQYALMNRKVLPLLKMRIMLASFSLTYNTLTRRGINRIMLILRLRKAYVRNDVMSVAEAVDYLSALLKQMNMNLQGILNQGKP